MKRKLFWALVALLALTVIVLVVVRSLPITYKGLALPTPAQVGPDGVLPPAAWLIVGDKAVLASYGSFCYRAGLVFGPIACGDAPAPWGLPDLAATTLPAETPAVVVIAFTAIKEFRATVRPWTEGPVSVPVTTLKAESKREGNVTAFTLGPIGDAGDQFLEVFVTYNQGDASYLWRLNPSLTETPTPSESDSTADWQVYTNTKHNFTLMYPPGWQYLEVPTPTYRAANDEVWFTSSGWPPPNTDARPNLSLIMTEHDPSPNWQPQYFNDYKAEPFKLGNVSATKISGTNKESLYPELVVIAKVGGFYVQALPNQTPESLQYFELILSTFKFLD